MECTADMLLKAGGQMDFQSGGSMNFGAGGGLNFTSASGGGTANMTVGKLNIKANEVNID
jgi:hypothetical protein